MSVQNMYIIQFVVEDCVQRSKVKDNMVEAAIWLGTIGTRAADGWCIIQVELNLGASFCRIVANRENIFFFCTFRAQLTLFWQGKDSWFPVFSDMYHTFTFWCLECESNGMLRSFIGNFLNWKSLAVLWLELFILKNWFFFLTLGGKLGKKALFVSKLRAPSIWRYV